MVMMIPKIIKIREGSMKGFKILYALAALQIIAACAYGPASITEPAKPAPQELAGQIKTESELLAGIQDEFHNSLEKVASRELKIEPVRPVYDPLEDHTVSFAMVEEDFFMILYSLAQSVGLNLIIDPAISRENRSVTLNFEKVSAATVLKEILNAFDLYYQIEDNVIRVKPFEERIFKLNFLDMDITADFDVGGDVFGAGDIETSSGLSGSFRLKGEGAKKGNSYDIIEDMLKQITRGGQGRFSLNRLSGSLYVKDTPAVIASISKLISHLKEMLSRQILIEARIIEVILADEYQYGIDWELVRKEASTVTKLNNASWSLTSGLVLSGNHRAFTVSGMIDALNIFGDSKVVSNPSIRAQHGKPAMISVGTSFTYKKSVEITSTSTSAEDTDTTEVEVSTVFDGLILGVIPFIEPDGKITLFINPIKSDVEQSSLEVRSVAANADQSVSLPIVHIKEISTTIGLRSGDTVVLGGLIDKRRIVENKGLPVLSAIPLAGYLFKNEQKIDQTRELVIILKVDVI